MELHVHARVVLGVLYVEGPAHGFAIARALSPDSDLGRVWSIARPQVYRAIEQLAEAGQVNAGELESGGRGPGRTPYRVSRKGSRAARAWLETPVEHLREARTELLMKLLLRDRLGWARLPFLDQQHAIFAAIAENLEVQAASDPDDVVAAWRAETAGGVLAATRRLRPDH